jgi:hypothetical protein
VPEDVLRTFLPGVGFMQPPVRFWESTCWEHDFTIKFGSINLDSNALFQQTGNEANEVENTFEISDNNQPEAIRAFFFGGCQ